MKIRIKSNSLRIRITRSELMEFKNTGYLEEKTEFGNNTLTYALAKHPTGNHLSAKFSENKITLFIPEQLSQDWTETERVGFEHEMEIGNGKKLFLILEKDYQCLDQVAEDQRDQFENPRKIN